MSLTTSRLFRRSLYLDMGKAKDFYEGKLGLSGGEVKPDGGIRYPCGAGSALHVYPSADNAGKSPATLAAFQVDDIETTVDELAANGVTFEQYDIAPDHDQREGHRAAGQLIRRVVQGFRRQPLCRGPRVAAPRWSASVDLVQCRPSWERSGRAGLRPIYLRGLLNRANLRSSDRSERGLAVPRSPHVAKSTGFVVQAVAGSNPVVHPSESPRKGGVSRSRDRAMIVSVVDVATNAAPDDDRLLRRGGGGNPAARRAGERRDPQSLRGRWQVRSWPVNPTLGREIPAVGMGRL